MGAALILIKIAALIGMACTAQAADDGGYAQNTSGHSLEKKSLRPIQDRTISRIECSNETFNNDPILKIYFEVHNDQDQQEPHILYAYDMCNLQSYKKMVQFLTPFTCISPETQLKALGYPGHAEVTSLYIDFFSSED